MRPPGSDCPSESLWHALNGVQEFLFLADHEGRIHFWNSGAERLFGYRAEEILGRALAILCPDAAGSDDFHADLLRRAWEQDGLRTGWTARHRSGNSIRIELELLPTRLSNEAQIGFLGIGRKAPSSRPADSGLCRNSNLAEVVAHETPEPVFVKDLEGRYLMINQAACAWLGRRAEEVIGKTDDEIFPARYAAKVKADDRKVVESGRSCIFDETFQAAGRERFITVTKAPCRNTAGEMIGIIGIARDITERKVAEEKLRHDARHDVLTGLPNRAAFMEALSRALARSRRHPDIRFAVLFFDLDRFKIINDSLGHLAGDELLITVGDRIRRCLRQDDTVARLGGDEFAVLLDSVNPRGEAAAATRIARRIQEELSHPYQLQGQEVFSGASVGIALHGPSYDRPEELLRDADNAMYRAKRRGDGRNIEVFDPGMHENAVALLRLESDLRRAVERGEFFLQYQPIISLQTRLITGFEALLRWRHPELGLVPPLEFIPLAEDTGLIYDLGSWALRQACGWMRAWRNEETAPRRLTLNVNLSGRQLVRPELVDGIERAIADTGLDPRSLKLEITEATVMEKATRAAESLERLRALGVQLIIDDFGTGCSALSSLSTLPIDALKIDRTFVTALGSGEERAEIVRCIIAMASALSMDVVAEGVETAQQAEILRSFGCRYAQGYLFSPPVDADAARRLVVRGRL